MKLFVFGKYSNLDYQCTGQLQSCSRSLRNSNVLSQIRTKLFTSQSISWMSTGTVAVYSTWHWRHRPTDGTAVTCYTADMDRVPSSPSGISQWLRSDEWCQKHASHPLNQDSNLIAQFHQKTSVKLLYYIHGNWAYMFGLEKYHSAVKLTPLEVNVWKFVKIWSVVDTLDFNLYSRRPISEHQTRQWHCSSATEHPNNVTARHQCHSHWRQEIDTLHCHMSATCRSQSYNKRKSHYQSNIDEK